MSDDSPELHLKVRHRNRPPKPYKWEIYRGNDPICIKRAMHAYPTQQAAANAGEKALLRFLESEALKQEQGIMADKHFKPPEPPNDNAKSIDRWDDEGGAPSGGRSVRKRPEGPAPSAQVHAEGFEQALRALRAACPLPFEKVPSFKWSLPRRAVDDWGQMNCTTITVRI
jgi:hypothetical protein